MRRAILHIFKLIIVLREIYRLEIEKRLKNEIRETWLKVFFLNRYDSKNKTANIVGYEVKFIEYYELSYLFNEIFLNNEYHFSAENDKPYIIDCGSNIGMSIIYFKMLYPNSRILAFEPGEEAYSCLEQNVKNNKINSVRLYKAALSNRKGTLDFYYDHGNLGSLHMSNIQERMPRQKCSVEALILSEHIDEEVDLLKLDIEGAELEVVEELGNSGRLGHVKQMIIEYHHHIVKDSDDFSKILTILENTGFGYQIECNLERPLVREKFQDILIYAYRKKSTK